MIRSGAFNGCNSLKQHPIKEIEIGQVRYRLLLNNQNAIVIGASSKNIQSVEIPEEITYEGTKYQVQVIEKNAFVDLDKLESVTLSEGIETIETEAFWGCGALKSITYTGTKAQWGQVVREVNWNSYSPISVVHCSDGDVAI